MQGLPLSYLIDALAQLQEQVAQRAAASNAAEHDALKRARDEGCGGAAEDLRIGDWPGERADWYQAIAPLRALCLQRLRRELEHDEGAGDADKLLALLIAAARRRDGASITVDTALGQ